MKDVHVLGVHPDGNQLILSDDEGARYSLQITDALRDACKVSAPLRPVASPRTTADPTPREIQELVRAGASADEITREFGTPVEKVRRYEGPILAERAHAATQAQHTPIGADHDSLTLGDLVVDRLAARGVSPHSLTWDAVRAGHGKPWEIIVRFVQNAEEREAHWSLDPDHHHVSAIDEEAAWLTERTVPAGRDRGPTLLPIGTDAADADTTEALLDTLNDQRGIRQDIDMSEFTDDDVPEAPEVGPRVVALAASTIPTPPAPPEPDEDTDEATEEAAEEEATTGTLPGLEGLETEAHTQTQPLPRKSGRRSVPSWEEIMFGSQPR